MHKRLITFDCGLAYVGAALFDYSNKTLLDCYYIDTPIPSRDSAEQTADLVNRVHSNFMPHLEESLIVVEYPEQ